MENARNQLDLIFHEPKGLYTYLVITALLMEIKPLQATKEGCLPAQNRLSRLQSQLSRLLPTLSRLGRLPLPPSLSRLGLLPSRPSRLPLLVPKLA